jgi:hypothetical protein
MPYQRHGGIGIVDLQDSNVGRVFPQSIGSGPDDARTVVMFLSFLQLTQRVYANVIADLPSMFTVAHTMQRGQHEAAANEQSRAKRSFGADLDQIDEWLVVRCDDDHRGLSRQLG